MARGHLHGAVSPQGGASFELTRAFEAYKAGRLDKAEASLRRVLRSTPTYPAALNLLGLIELGRGQPAKAIKTLERALAVAPKVADLHFTLGNALRIAGRDEAALRSYAKAIELRPNLAAAHTNLG